MVYKRVRGWTLEPVQKFVEYPPSTPPPPTPAQAKILSFLGVLHILGKGAYSIPQASLNRHPT